MYKILTAMLISLMLTACSSMDEPELYHRINEAYDFEVTHCDSFAMVTGIGRGERALRNAKVNAMNHGEELGGTHIVWLQTDHGDPTKVVAVIYKCLQ
ncbi:conserved hypothetical protein [Shewanella woodyi ATCC 51908]|uniref:Lipoprotein n=2 Tax=Shewanella woodyi TaxID=60961 RepID=B1KI87_SHEWM|nr:conserved hypothetical protein [Shewanella woodyi ATCC 51908]